MLDGQTHPQCAAPGFAMWYLWVICHLDNNPYQGPNFIPEYQWVLQPDAIIWPDRAGTNPAPETSPAGQ